jgi:OOP family OmpA-OmpF porin
MRNKLIFTALLSTLTTGCATQERIILLPQQDGKPSAVRIRSASNKEVTLDRPYMTASVGAYEIEVGKTDAQEVNTKYSEVISANPPSPKRFLLFYEYGEIQLTAESAQLLEKVKSELKSYPAGEVVVIGHTDRVGSEKWNDQLSLRRAESVKELLIKIGIPENIIQVAGRGEREPLVPTKDEVEEAQNRRVEIKVK